MAATVTEGALNVARGVPIFERPATLATTTITYSFSSWARLRPVLFTTSAT